MNSILDDKAMAQRLIMFIQWMQATYYSRSSEQRILELLASQSSMTVSEHTHVILTSYELLSSQDLWPYTMVGNLLLPFGNSSKNEPELTYLDHPLSDLSTLAKLWIAHTSLAN